MREPAAPRWLLMLGSTRSDAGLMHAALQQLAATGTAQWLTAMQRGPAYNHSGLTYFNALAVWQPGADTPEPRAEIRRIEALLGRDRSRHDEVAIDIDLLACFTGSAWHACPHAVDKGEFEHGLVQTLLREAGVAIVQDDI